MGKNKRHGTWKNKKDKAKQPQVQENYDNSGFTKENKAFEAYYKVPYFYSNTYLLFTSFN